jgi:putative two-component system response regulator
LLDADAIRGLLTAIELKDAATAAHTWRVTLYARALAESRGIAGDRLRRVTVGRRGLGHDRLRSMGLADEDILGMVRSHHERWDGGGYPDGLAGEAIPMGARFLAVIDVFDAMTSVRPYRDEVGEPAAKRALEMIRAGRGDVFCPECVDAFEDLYRSGGVNWILHYYNDGEQSVSFESIEHLDDAIRGLAP